MSRRDIDKQELKLLRKRIEKRNEDLAGTFFYRTLDFVLYTLLVMLFALAIRAVILEPVRVDGLSMHPTLETADYMLVDKLGYAFAPPRRGDIVVTFFPNGTDKTFVKRVIGLPGEHVSIIGGQVYINGLPLEEPYLKVELTNAHDGEWDVPLGEIFVLGDNRMVSLDSTREGSIPLERVIGRARTVLFPLKDGKILIRPTYKLP